MSYSKSDLTRQAYRYIKNYFDHSRKKHLIITGEPNSGKSTLLNRVICNIGQDKNIYGLKTDLAVQKKVYLTDTKRHKTSVIGEYNASTPCNRLKMAPIFSGFDNGITAIETALLSDNDFFYIDEIGYLEKDCTIYLNKLRELFDKKRVIAVTRKSVLPFIKRLWDRKDVCVFDLDKTQVNISVVVMASGLSKRYGENKLIKPLGNNPLIFYAIDKANLDLFADRVLLTRKKKTAVLGESKIKTIIHNYPTKAQSISLAVKTLVQNKNPDGIMFLQADQPFVSKETLYMLCYAFSQNSDKICRLSYMNTDSSPVIFPKKLFCELSNISKNNSGKSVIKSHPDDIVRVTAKNEKELLDIDKKEDLLKAESIL